MATDTPPTDAGERRRSVVRSSPEVPFSGFYSRANAAAERRAAAARNAIIEWSDWTSDSHPTRRTRLRKRHYGWFLRKPRYWRTLRRAGAQSRVPAALQRQESCQLEGQLKWQSIFYFAKVAVLTSEQQHKTFDEWFKASVASNLNQTSGR